MALLTSASILGGTCLPDTNGIHAGVSAATHDIAQILKMADLVC